jgi:hypothetical protein
MKTETRFAIGDKVYAIRKSQQVQTITCPACDGEGELVLRDGDTSTCPRCHGRKTKQEYGEVQWNVEDPCIRVGLVRAIAAYDEPYKEEYMCHATGVHSGTVWRWDDLFPTNTAAQDECDKRNSSVETVS